MAIPRIIHQVWFRFGDGPEHPPAEYDELRASWKLNHPDWTIIYWTEEKARIFLTQQYPEYVELFNLYKKPIMRVDAIRYFLLDHFGGVYTDMDTRSLQSLEVLRSHPVVLVKDVNPMLGLNNGFMMSTPGHPLMKSCIASLKLTAKLPDPIWATGPLFLSGNWMFSKTKGDLRVLEVKELKEYLHHYHHASWTWIAKARQLMDPRRRALMKPEEIPAVLRFFFPSD